MWPGGTGVLDLIGSGGCLGLTFVVFPSGTDILLAVAVILLLFSFVDLLDRLRLILPENIQQAVQTEMLTKVKRGIRIGILALVAIAFIYTQRGLFPPWLWEYALWRYLVIIVVLFMVYMLGRFLIKSLSGMTSLSSSPFASNEMCSPREPSSSISTVLDARATSPMLRSPIFSMRF